MLNQKIPAIFENLGSEAGLLKFRVKLGEPYNNTSEILIYVDESLKLPIKQQFYSINGEQRTLTFSVEMKDFKFETDEKFFELPEGYRRVSPKEFKEIVWKEPTKNE
jgi:hypothetical protein